MAGPRRVLSTAILVHTAVLVLVVTVLRPAAATGIESVDFPEAVARTLARNASVAAAGYQWTSAKKDAEAARGRNLPKLTFEERFVRTNIPAEAFALKLNEERLLSSDFADVDNFNKAPPINDFITSFTIEQPLFAPRAYLGYRMAGREAQATGLDVSRRKEEAVFQVLSAYLDVLTAKEFVQVADRALSDAREHLRIAQVKERTGVGLASDVLRARVFLASAESGKVTAESRLALAQTALGLAMGEGRGTRVDAAAPPPPLPEAGVLSERIAAIRDNRSDLRAVSLRLSNAETNVTLRKSDYLPALGATGTYQIDGQDGIFSPDNRTWRIGVGLSWNLFDGLSREAEVGKAAAQSRKARELYRGTEDLAAFQVTRAFLAVEEAARRVEISRASVDAASEGARLVASRYENQLARMIDVLDAQSALNAARADLVRAENDLRQSRAGLEFASGTLLPWASPGSGATERRREGQ